ncbi:MAG: hypothetical protein BMS9Abin13_380 [Patescibacteria group bacterium]|nr:MAG: hypothetical protein BMS9Abin13_380 [Patescibacteria group bacterium]
MSKIRSLPSRVRAKEVGLTIPPNMNPELYRAGYEHGLKSNTLTNFKASYRAGFRCAKLEQKAKSRVASLPQKMKFMVRKP